MTKTDTFGRILKKQSTTSAISIKQVVVALHDRTGNPRVIHPPTKIVSIAVSLYIIF